MVLKLPKIVHFLQIFADFNKKLKFIKEIYFFLSERPHHALSENSIFLGVSEPILEFKGNVRYVQEGHPT